MSENFLGLCAERKLPKWSIQPFRDKEGSSKSHDKSVVLFADTFGTWFEPQGLRDAVGFDQIDAAWLNARLLVGISDAAGLALRRGGINSAALAITAGSHALDGGVGRRIENN